MFWRLTSGMIFWASGFAASAYVQNQHVAPSSICLIRFLLKEGSTSGKYVYAGNGNETLQGLTPVDIMENM
jgi:hypothetical protein